MIKRISVILTAIYLGFGCQLMVSENEIKTIIDRHLLMRPEMRAEDVYKLLYQRHMGIGHLIGDTDRAKKYLSEEISNIDENDVSVHDSLLEFITTDSSIVRVNLRPFKKEKLSETKLFQAMLGTVNNLKTSKSELINDWSDCIKLINSRQISFHDTNTVQFSKFLRENDYPVVHHSQSYSRAYKPAYRILLYQEWKKYFTDTH